MGRRAVSMDYEEAVSYIEDIPRFTKKSEPGQTAELMKRLGNPERDFRTVHVAGTNGKGSVCAMLEQALRDAGVKTGLFISPHLSDIRERILIGGELCSREAFLRAFLSVKEKLADMEAGGYSHPAFFEFLFAMGMLIFAEAGVETAVVETGLGGRLDATNCIPSPELTVITSIGLDHMKYLGETIPEIASEKAGILKKRCPAVFDGSKKEASGVIRERSRELSIPFYEIGPERIRDLTIRGGRAEFAFESLSHGQIPLSLPFPALYQGMNGGVAFAAAELLPELSGLSPERIAGSFGRTVWHGRMERLSSGVYLDGAHNPDGVREFVRSARILSEDSGVLLFSQMKDKDTVSSVKELSRYPWRRIYLTSVPGGAGRDPEELKELFLGEGFEASSLRVILEPMEAYRSARYGRGEGETLFCAGSLYLIGEILRNANRD